MVFHKEEADTGPLSTRAAVREISSKCLCFCAKNAHRIVGKVSIVGIVGKYNERHTGGTHCLERKATRTSGTRVSVERQGTRQSGVQSHTFRTYATPTVRVGVAN